MSQDLPEKPYIRSHDITKDKKAISFSLPSAQIYRFGRTRNNSNEQHKSKSKGISQSRLIHLLPLICLRGKAWSVCLFHDPDQHLWEVEWNSRWAAQD